MRFDTGRIEAVMQLLLVASWHAINENNIDNIVADMSFPFDLLLIVFGVGQHRRDVEHYLMALVDRVNREPAGHVPWKWKDQMRDGVFWMACAPLMSRPPRYLSQSFRRILSPRRDTKSSNSALPVSVNNNKWIEFAVGAMTISRDMLDGKIKGVARYKATWSINNTAIFFYSLIVFKPPVYCQQGYTVYFLKLKCNKILEGNIRMNLLFLFIELTNQNSKPYVFFNPLILSRNLQRRKLLIKYIICILGI